MRERQIVPRGERARRTAVALLFAFYALLLAEGPLRKWVLPEASNALVFIRDPVMVAILVLYARMGVSAAMRPVLAVYLALVLLLTGLAAAQLATSAVPALALLAGLRNYLLFVPLCCVVHDAFRAEDVARWVRLNLWLAMPVALLVVAQYRAGPSAWINAVPGGGNDGTFMLVEDVVRPYGLFSFTLGHSAYAAWMIGPVLAAAVARRRLAVAPLGVAAGGLGVIVMGLFSGARTFWLLAACVLACFLAIAMPLGRPAQRRLVAASMAGLVSAAAAVFVLQPSLAGDLLERQSTATASEGATSDRVARVATEFVDELARAPTLGFGLGSGTNIANYLANGRTDHVLAEYELTRIVQELGPFVGLAIILLRWLAVAWFARLAVETARRGNLQPACYLGFLAPVFLVHDITLQNSMIGIAWFAAGIFLASVRGGADCAEPARSRRRPLLRPRAGAPQCA